MTLEELKSVLAAAEVTHEGEWAELPEGRTATVHVACNGVGLSISRVTALKFVSPLLHAKTSREELFVVSTADVFAFAVDLGSHHGRKAGFVSGEGPPSLVSELARRASATASRRLASSEQWQPVIPLRYRDFFDPRAKARHAVPSAPVRRWGRTSGQVSGRQRLDIQRWHFTACAAIRPIWVQQNRFALAHSVSRRACL